MKKAFAWLDGHGVRYEFHDYKTAGIDIARLKTWSQQVGWEVLLNTRGTTWRKLSPTQQAHLDEGKALKLMNEHPSLIKRPVLENGNTLLVGFVPERYTEAFKKIVRGRRPAFPLTLPLYGRIPCEARSTLLDRYPLAAPLHRCVARP